MAGGQRGARDFDGILKEPASLRRPPRVEIDLAESGQGRDERRVPRTERLALERERTLEERLGGAPAVDAELRGRDIGLGLRDGAVLSTEDAFSDREGVLEIEERLGRSSLHEPQPSAAGEAVGERGMTRPEHAIVDGKRVSEEGDPTRKKP
jgi:hypothetical protein